MIARGKDWLQRSMGIFFLIVMKLALYHDLGGSYVTECIYQNLKNYTLKMVNFTVCKLLHKLDFLKNQQQKCGILLDSSLSLYSNHQKILLVLFYRQIMCKNGYFFSRWSKPFSSFSWISMIASYPVPLLLLLLLPVHSQHSS